MFDMPFWIVAMLYVLPLVIIIIVISKALQLINSFRSEEERDVMRKVEGGGKSGLSQKMGRMKRRLKSKVSIDDNTNDAILKFIPYVFILYYIGRFATYILIPAAWGWTGDDYVVAPVRDSTIAMQELLLSEGLLVVLLMMIISTILRCINGVFGEGGR